MDKRKLAVAYVFLVGLPLLGLVLILHAGSRLTAPLAVRGDWVADADLSSWRDAPCAQLLTETRQPVLRIAQSASDLTVTLNNPGKTVLTGTIEGKKVDASVPCEQEEGGGSPKLSPGYPGPPSLHLQALVSDQASRDP